MVSQAISASLLQTREADVEGDKITTLFLQKARKLKYESLMIKDSGSNLKPDLAGYAKALKMFRFYSIT